MAWTFSFTLACTVASSGFSNTSVMSAAICSISGSFIPRVVTAGVPRRMPLVTSGFSGSIGDEVLVRRDTGAVERFLGDFAGEFLRAQIHEHQVIVSAAADDAEAQFRQGRRQAPEHSSRSVVGSP